MEQLVIFSIGATGYGLLEFLWRGYTHWTMVITGGICFYLLFYIFNTYENVSLITKCITGSIVITTIELLVGLLVNVKLGWRVWDYSNVPYNILGQICPLYSILWFVLSIPLVYITKWLHSVI